VGRVNGRDEGSGGGGEEGRWTVRRVSLGGRENGLNGGCRELRLGRKNCEVGEVEG